MRWTLVTVISKKYHIYIYQRYFLEITEEGEGKAEGEESTSSTLISIKYQISNINHVHQSQSLSYETRTGRRQQAHVIKN